MNDKDFLDSIKSKVDQLKEKTLHNMLEQDSEYQDAVKNQLKLEKDYMELKISESDRNVINKFLDSIDLLDMEYSTYSYIAGLYDSERIKTLINLSGEKKTTVSLVKQLYNGKINPGKQLKESKVEGVQSELEDVFTYGFKLGSQFMIELIQN